MQGSPGGNNEGKGKGSSEGKDRGKGNGGKQGIAGSGAGNSARVGPGGKGQGQGGKRQQSFVPPVVKVPPAATTPTPTPTTTTAAGSVPQATATAANASASAATTAATAIRRGSFSKKFSPKYLPQSEGGHILSLPDEGGSSHGGLHRPSSSSLLQSKNMSGRSIPIEDAVAAAAAAAASSTPGTSLSRAVTPTPTAAILDHSKCHSGSANDLRALSPFYTSEGTPPLDYHSYIPANLALVFFHPT